jgi:nucleoside-diphosphate-sugar epimerase
MAELDVVTGAFSYTGRHIAVELLARGRRVRTLTRRPDPSHPLADKVEVAPLSFDASLVESLRGADTLYTTYWVRFERGPVTFDSAVANIGVLLDAAVRAGIRRVVHVSVANPGLDSPFPYFRGKAQAEELVRASGLSFAIVRPTLVFGPDDILVNDIAWILRRTLLFLVPGDGRYEVQPVSVGDTARICVEASARSEDVVVDAAGPERFAFEEFVRLIAARVGSRARIRTAPAGVALAAARVLGACVRDVVLTRDEVDALVAGLLVSDEPPRGRDLFEVWLSESGSKLGRGYQSELRRNFRGYS